MAGLTAEQFSTLMQDELPWAVDAGMQPVEVGEGRATLRLPFGDRSLRPGGTVSGPTMMALADATMYAVVLGAIGEIRLAVTTNFNIHFLRMAGAVDLIAEGRMIKLGSRLAVVEVTLFAEGDHEPVAHATGTYSIPPSKSVVR